MMSLLAQAYEYDIEIRQFDEHASPEGVVIRASDISEGFAYERDGVKVTAFDVDHAPVQPAFGYRIDYGRRSVVLSGDTRLSENLIRHAEGVDLLVHEVAAPETYRRAGESPERAKTIIAHHTTAEQAGVVFSRVKPRLAVFSHIGRPSATEQDLIPPTRKTYAGPVEVGEDLMVIEVGDEIKMRRPAGISR
jgi:ribonuclease Z